MMRMVSRTVFVHIQQTILSKLVAQLVRVSALCGTLYVPFYPVLLISTKYIALHGFALLFCSLVFNTHQQPMETGRIRKKG